MPTPAYKRCSKCKAEKPLADFSRERRATDGRQSYCKACELEKCRVWRQANREREAQRKKRWREQNPAIAAAVRKQWREKNPERIAANDKRREERYPEKARARQRLNRAVGAGKLSKPEFCGSCGAFTESRNLHGHHEDYSKPLEVEWLCQACHRERHSSSC